MRYAGRAFRGAEAWLMAMGLGLFASATFLADAWWDQRNRGVRPVHHHLPLLLPVCPAALSPATLNSVDMHCCWMEAGCISFYIYMLAPPLLLL